MTNGLQERHRVAENTKRDHRQYQQWARTSYQIVATQLTLTVLSHATWLGSWSTGLLKSQSQTAVNFQETHQRLGQGMLSGIQNCEFNLEHIFPVRSVQQVIEITCKRQSLTSQPHTSMYPTLRQQTKLYPHLLRRRIFRRISWQAARKPPITETFAILCMKTCRFLCNQLAIGFRKSLEIHAHPTPGTHVLWKYHSVTPRLSNCTQTYAAQEKQNRSRILTDKCQ